MLYIAPPPMVPAWFELFHSNPLVGPVDMDLLLIVDYVLMALVFLALWAALAPVHQSMMTLAMVLEVIAVSSYMPSAGAFEMLSLSREFAAAATDADRSAINWRWLRSARRLGKVRPSL